MYLHMFLGQFSPYGQTRTSHLLRKHSEFSVTINKDTHTWELILKEARVLQGQYSQWREGVTIYIIRFIILFLKVHRIRNIKSLVHSYTTDIYTRVPIAKSLSSR
jgi:hypothetical protein